MIWLLLKCFILFTLSPLSHSLYTLHLPLTTCHLAAALCSLSSLMIWAVWHTLRMINILFALDVCNSTSASINNSSFANNGCQVSHKYFKLRAKFMKISEEPSSKVPQHPSGLASSLALHLALSCLASLLSGSFFCQLQFNKLICLPKSFGYFISHIYVGRLPSGSAICECPASFSSSCSI